MTKPMTQETRNKINSITDIVGDGIHSLYCRWQDEKEYEDFKEYKDLMKKRLLDANPSAKNVKVGKRPFGVKFDMDEFSVTISATSTRIKWSAKPAR